jgi:hypothetical protein
MTIYESLFNRSYAIFPNGFQTSKWTDGHPPSWTGQLNHFMRACLVLRAFWIGLLSSVRICQIFWPLMDAMCLHC